MRITKEELRIIGFEPWFDVSERTWSLDGDRIMYDITEQALYDSDEVKGNHIKLCVIKNVDDLKEMIYSYFGVDTE